MVVLKKGVKLYLDVLQVSVPHSKLFIYKSFALTELISVRLKVESKWRIFLSQLSKDCSLNWRLEEM